MCKSVSSTISVYLVWSPDRFSGCHVGRRATVTGFHLHTHSIIRIWQRWVQEGGACGGIGAWWKDPWWGAWINVASSSSHHGELVWAGSAGVIQVIGWGGRLEGPILCLVGGVRWVGWRQIGVVPPSWSSCHGCCHGDAKSTTGDRVVGGSVGKGRCRGRVVDSWIREAGVRQWREGGERPF